MIETFAENGRKHDIDAYDHVLFSYHGLPVRQLGKVDCTGVLKCPDFGCEECKVEKKPYCYLSQCYATTRALVAKLGLNEDQYTLCFQSRLGKTPWIQPYTSDTLHQLAERGVKKLLVFSPAFVADCIETLDEIQVEYANEFKSLGGEEVAMVESLNSHPKWIQVLKRLALNNLQIMLIFNAILLFLVDFYIFCSLRATKIKFLKSKLFSFLWWGYSIGLLVGLYISAKYNIPLAYRSIILVAFFM